MDALRLLCIVCGLSAMTAFAPGVAYGQDAAGVEVTSGAIGVDIGLDGDAPGVVALLQVPIEEERGAADLIPLEALPDEVSALAPAVSLRPVVRDSWAVPVARWDDHPNGSQWTAAVLSALRGPGASLLDTEPRDIHAWCPGYLQASPEQRAAFWTGLISALAWHESTHDPRAVGGGGRWFGLVQIAPGTARWRDCDVGTGEALLHGASNLRCGIRIMGITVPRDNVISEGMRGVAADWGPFHSRRKREDMRTWVRGQEYCQAPPALVRPVMRPADLGDRVEVLERDASGGTLRPVPRPQSL